MAKLLTQVLLTAVLGVALSACNEAKTPEIAVAASPASSAQESSTPSKVVSKEEAFVASGPIVVEHQVDVAAQRDGVLSQIHADVGTVVKEGQILARLDDLQITADLEAARAKTRSTEADLHNWESEAKVLQSDYERARKMWDAELITKEQLEHAQFKAESDKWEIKRAEELLVNNQRMERSLELEMEKTQIRSPFSGIVARRYIRAGQQVNKGDRMFWVTASSPLQVKFTLPERLLGKVRTGQFVEVITVDSTGTPFQARVIEISPVIDPASGTIEVLAQLVGPTGDLRPGMATQIRLVSIP
jgi:RND family efflux transporter MFP subunit